MDVASVAPNEFQVFPYGEIQIEGGPPFVVDDAIMDRIVERFSARGLDMVVDYEHQTEANVEAPAAGWIKRLVNRGTAGLWAVVEWTARAREYLANREYRYFSPVFMLSPKNGLVELLRVGLTNAPRLNGISPIVAKWVVDEPGPDREQLLINGLLGISDWVWAKYRPDNKEPEPSVCFDEVQRQINRLVGVDDVTWRKYNPRQRMEVSSGRYQHSTKKSASGRFATVSSDQRLRGRYSLLLLGAGLFERPEVPK